MAEQIKDGTGKGYLVEIDNENRIVTKSTTEDVIAHVNHKNGDAYSLIVSKTPTGAGDCFCYIKNTSDKNLKVNSIKLYTASDEIIQIKLKDVGTPVGGTTIVPVNRNTLYSDGAEGVFQEGVDITGLSNGSVVDQVFVKGASSSLRISWDSQLIINTNHTLTFYAVTGGIAIKMTVSLYYISE